jgi:tetratricopeptide (TPR) repeat protein
VARKTELKKRNRIAPSVGVHRRTSKLKPQPGVVSAAALTRNDVWILVGLIAATVAVYAQVLGHQFINLDDDLYITRNPIVARGLSFAGIAWAFTTFHAGNWHPLTWLSHMLDGQLFGLHAAGHLFVNVLIHCANVALVFCFLRRVTGAPWRCGMVAALFALHPLHVESVAWAAERKDTLAAFFGLLTLLAYSRYVEARSVARYLPVALFLALGLMAKPMLVTWPFLLVLLDYWPLRRLVWPSAGGFRTFVKAGLPLVREKLPLFAIVAASIVVTYIAQSRGGTVRAMAEASLSLRFSNTLVSDAKYLLATFWPDRLGVYYPFAADGIPGWQIAASLLLLGGITVSIFQQAPARPYLIVGWLWFLGTLVPVIGLVQVGGQSMADRYHYLPSIGLFIAIVFGGAEIVAVRRLKTPLIAALCAAVILICATLTALQVARWRDSVTLFRHTLSVTSDNFIIQYNLAQALAAERNYDEALIHFGAALRIVPDSFDALMGNGVTLSETGRLPEAVACFERALQIAPTAATAHTQLALALVKENRAGDAILHFQRALELAPQDGDVRVNLGLMLARQGKLTEAAEQLQEAVRLNPDSAEAHNNLGLVLLAGGKARESIPYFSTALRLKPDLAVARDNLQRAQTQMNAHPQ